MAQADGTYKFTQSSAVLSAKPFTGGPYACTSGVQQTLRWAWYGTTGSSTPIYLLLGNVGSSGNYYAIRLREGSDTGFGTFSGTSYNAISNNGAVSASHVPHVMDMTFVVDSTGVTFVYSDGVNPPFTLWQDTTYPLNGPIYFGLYAPSQSTVWYLYDLQYSAR